MTGRRSFSTDEAEELRRLIREKQTADASRQKSLRARIRRIGFRISEYEVYGGFTVSDFDDLVHRGVVTITDGGEVPAEAPPLAVPSVASGPVRRREATEAELDAALDSLDGRPRRIGADVWPGDVTGLDRCGLYSWWVDGAGARDLTAGLGHPLDDGRIYAGQTGATKWPSGGTGANTLRKRIHQHITGQIRGSTFRLTLAAALADALALEHVGPKQLAPRSNAELTAWVRRHLQVAVHPFSEPDALVDLERRVLARLDPPLNLDGMPPTVLRARVGEQRARLGRPPS